MLSLNLTCVTLDQVWVYGNNFESFLVAVVVRERQALEEWERPITKIVTNRNACQIKTVTFVRNRILTLIEREDDTRS
jgi:long-subunit acyl-CoA synthetase (AMP-forming)